MTANDAAADGSQFRREVRFFLELLGIYAIAVAQPIFSIVEKSPELFVLLGVGRWGIVLYAVIVLLVVPVTLWAVERLTEHVNPTARQSLHVTLIASGTGLFALQFIQETLGAAWVVAFLAAAVAGVGAGFGYVRFRAMRTWIVFLSPAAVLIGVLFLVASPIADLVLPTSTAVADVSPSEPAVPVVLVILDEFPTMSLLDADGAVDGALFPTLAGVADNGTWYRNATTIAPFTPMAVPSIQTGRPPPTGTVAPIAAAHPESVYTLLGGSYAFNNLELFAVCPSSLCEPTEVPSAGEALRQLLGLSRDLFVEQLTPSEETDAVVAGYDQERNAVDEAALVDDFDNFVDQIRGGRTLSLAHILVPHHPWLLYPSGRTSNADFERTDVGTVGDWNSDESANVGRQLHLLQTMAADRMLGEMLDHLRATDMYEDALVIVTADHGESFEHGEVRRLGTERNISEIAWVPLFVKYPGQTTGEVVDDNVLTIDVLPTIADVVGVEFPWDASGTSLLSAPRDTRDKPFIPMPDSPEDWYPFGRPIDGEMGFQTLLDRAASRFVDTIDPKMRPYARGEHGELVGRSVQDFAVGSPIGGGEFRTVSPSEIARDQADAGIVPGWVTGTIPADVDGDPQLAYVVDGSIVATSATFEPDEGRREFRTLLPEEVVGTGAVKVFVVDDDSGAIRLSEMSFDG